MAHWEMTVENEKCWTDADLRRAVRDWEGPPRGEPEAELLVVARPVTDRGFEWAFLGWCQWGGLLLWPTPHADVEASLRDLTREEPIDSVAIADDSIDQVFDGGGDNSLRVYPEDVDT
jgi:hypothetical protein